MTYPYNRKNSNSKLTLAIRGALTTLIGLSMVAGAQDDENRNRYNLILEEVLVTAQKREESTLTVPIAVDSFTAQDLINTGATDIGQIDDYMPGVEINSNQTTQTGITIRGVSSPVISTAGDPSIATFYDGSYLPRAATAIPLVDIDRIEVLKGPQGTLFGRNASVGVINIIPNRPTNEFEGFAKARIGNHGLMRLEGMLNTPITDDLALRTSLFSNERDGIVNNEGIGKDLKDEDFQFVRTALAWDISDATSIQFAADYEDRESAPSYSIGVSKYALSTDPFSGRTSNDVIDRREEREMWGSSVQLDHEFSDRLSMFGIVSYREWETWNLQDEDGTADPYRYFDSNNIEDSDIWYTEVRFNFVDGPLNLIFGANYSQEDVYQNTTIGTLADSYMQFVSTDPVAAALLGTGIDDHVWDLYGDGPILGLFTYEQLSDIAGTAFLPPSFAGDYIVENLENTGDFVNWGVFADATYDITDTVRVAAGLRYSYDEKDFTWQTNPKGVDWPVMLEFLNYDPRATRPGEPPLPEEEWYNKFEDSENWDDITGRFVLDWQFSDNAMTYVSYGTGFKSGGWDGNQFSSVAAGPYDPEEMTNYEIGLKGDFFENKLRLEVALFYQELEGKQNEKSTRNCASASDCSNDQTAAPTIVSSDEDTDGLEITARWSITDNLLLTGLTTTRDVEREEAAYYDGQGDLQGGSSKGSTDLDYTMIMDWSPEVPMGFLLVHIEYIFNEADEEPDDVYTTGRWYFQDRELLNARIAWSNEEENIEIAIWSNNIFDEEYAGNPGGFVADALGAYKTGIDDTRTYGVDLRYSF